jgi:hypothetical protein
VYSANNQGFQWLQTTLHVLDLQLQWTLCFFGNSLHVDYSQLLVPKDYEKRFKLEYKNSANKTKLQTEFEV